MNLNRDFLKVPVSYGTAVVVIVGLVLLLLRESDGVSIVIGVAVTAALTLLGHWFAEGRIDPVRDWAFGLAARRVRALRKWVNEAIASRPQPVASGPLPQSHTNWLFTIYASWLESGRTRIAWRFSMLGQLSKVTHREVRIVGFRRRSSLSTEPLGSAAHGECIVASLHDGWITEILGEGDAIHAYTFCLRRRDEAPGSVGYIYEHPVQFCLTHNLGADECDTHVHPQFIKLRRNAQASIQNSVQLRAWAEAEHAKYASDDAIHREIDLIVEDAQMRIRDGLK